jgi:hypothetical protein
LENARTRLAAGGLQKGQQNSAYTALTFPDFPNSSQRDWISGYSVLVPNLWQVIFLAGLREAGRGPRTGAEETTGSFPMS